MRLNETMAERLAAESTRAAKDEPDIARAYDSLVARLAAAGAGKSAPREGDRLPPFALPDDCGQLVRLSDLARPGPVVVSLNRGHWCSYCRIELEGLQSICDEVRQRGASIVAITPDRQAYTRKLRESSNLAFPLLSDIDNGYAMSLGLTVWCGEEVQALYRAAGLDLAESQGNDGWLIPIPATYVISGDGLIKGHFVEPDFRKRMSLERILGAV